MPFYATRDFDGERITRNADIRRFNTEAQAREYLLAPYANAGEWDIATAEIGPGSFSDCWIKTLDAPRVGTHWIAPFSYSQLYVQHPGEHPGGRMHWTTPTPDVLVVLGIKERADA